jgi:hypothetical protein
LLTVVCGIELAAASILLAVFGILRGLAIFLVALVPIVVVCMLIGLGGFFWRGLRATRGD